MSSGSVIFQLPRGNVMFPDNQIGKGRLRKRVYFLFAQSTFFVVCRVGR